MTFSTTYDKYYKFLLLLTLVLLLGSLFYLYNFYQETGDFAAKDTSLTGGTTITVFSQGEEINLEDLDSFLSERIDDFSLREITTLASGRQDAIVVESGINNNELKSLLEEYLGYNLNQENSSTEFTGSSLSSSFYNQLVKAIIIAFILMAIVVLIVFRTLIPSGAVILSAFSDIIMTLVVVNILGIKLSSAGIVAFLMLIGYSVDTDIMLTSRLLKQHEGTINSRLFDSFKTGLTMTLTSLAAVIIAFLLTSGFSNVLGQIFLILSIGLALDLLNTWITNASILKWYAEKKFRKHE